MAKQVAQIIQDYLEQAALERRYSEHSLRAYRHDLKEFQDYLAEQGVQDLEAIDALLLRGFLSSLLKKNRKATVGRKVAALRACFNFALAQGLDPGKPGGPAAGPQTGETTPALSIGRGSGPALNAAAGRNLADQAGSGDF